MFNKRIILLVLLSVSCLLAAVPPVVRAQEMIHYASTWGGTAHESVGNVAVDPQGNTYLTGFTFSFSAGQNDIYLLKYNSTGGLDWQRTWGGGGFDFGVGVAIAPSGHIYVTGFTSSFGAGQFDAVLLEYAADGSIVKQQTWGGSQTESVADMAVSADGSAYLVGYTNSTGAGAEDALILKFDSTGNLAWARTWGGAKPDSAIGTGLDTAGNLYVAGQSNSTGTGGYEATLLKFDPAGTLLWQRTWGGAGNDGLWDVSVDASGAAYFAGLTNTPGGQFDALLLRLDLNGNLVWERTWGGSQGDYGYGVATDKTGNVYMAGERFSGNSDAFLLKFASTGVLSYQLSWGGANTDFANRLTIDGNGNAVVAGRVYEAGPYSLNSLALSIGTPVIALSTPAFSPGVPVGILGPVSGQTSQPTGSTSYGGLSDSFVFTYGLPNISLTVSASPTTIQSGQTTTITVRATSDGTALGGVTVTLSSAAGTFSPASGTTNSTGYFVTTFTPSSVTSETTVTITATAAKPNYNDAIPKTLSLTATPPAMLRLS